MQRSTRKRAGKSHAHLPVGSTADPGDANAPLDAFYEIPPDVEVTLRELQELGQARFRALELVEERISENTDQDPAAALAQHGRALLDQLRTQCQLPNRGDTTGSARERHDARRRDRIAHFVLRLAFSASAPARERFVRLETILFRLRFNAGEFAAEEAVIRQRAAGTRETVPPGHPAHAFLCARAASFAAGEAISAYRVHWTRVLDIIARKQAVLRGGFAFVSATDVDSLIDSAFSAHLAAAIAAPLHEKLMRTDEYERLRHLLAYLVAVDTGADQQDTSYRGVIKHDQIPKVVRHFPLCMEELYRVLQRDRKLKHMERLQLGLFLKDAGVPLNDALVFWRAAFKDMNDDEYQKKNYAYSIRHNYGQEGRRQAYPAYSCLKIITTNRPGPQQHHGCPFREWQPSVLDERLAAKGVSADGRAAALGAVRGGHFTRACKCVLEATHESQLAAAHVQLAPIRNPNQYFDYGTALDSSDPAVREQVFGAAVETRGAVLVRGSRGSMEEGSGDVFDFDDGLADDGLAAMDLP